MKGLEGLRVQRTGEYRARNQHQENVLNGTHRDSPLGPDFLISARVTQSWSYPNNRLLDTPELVVGCPSRVKHPGAKASRLHLIASAICFRARRIESTFGRASAPCGSSSISRKRLSISFSALLIVG